MRTYDITTRVEIIDDDIEALAGAAHPDTDELAADTAANIVAAEIGELIATSSEVRHFIGVVTHEVKEVLT